MVPESHAVPQETAFAWLVGLSQAILPDHVLDCVQLAATVVRVDHDLLASYHVLLVPVHEVVVGDSVFPVLAHLVALAALSFTRGLSPLLLVTCRTRVSRSTRLMRSQHLRGQCLVARNSGGMLRLIGSGSRDFVVARRHKLVVLVQLTRVLRSLALVELLTLIGGRLPLLFPLSALLSAKALALVVRVLQHHAVVVKHLVLLLEAVRVGSHVASLVTALRLN